MNYAISDIHGCCREFQALLKKIHFSSSDTLFVLGDMIDRGPDPIGVLKLWHLIQTSIHLWEIMSLL